MSYIITTVEQIMISIFGVTLRSDLGNRGLRVWSFSADMIELMDEAAFRLVKGALPYDSTICQMSDSPILQYYPFPGAFMDRYSIILCSSAWSKVDPGDKIPQIDAIFSKPSPTSPITCEIQEIIEPEPSEQYQKLKSSLANIEKLSIKDGDVLVVKDMETMDILSTVELKNKPDAIIILSPGGVEQLKRAEVAVALGLAKDVGDDVLITGLMDVIGYRMNLKYLIETILNPESKSPDVINLARDIKEKILLKESIKLSKEKGFDISSCNE